MPTSVDITVAASPEDLARCRAAWATFAADESVDGGVFCDPVMVEQTTGFGDGTRIVLASCVEDGRVVGILPFRLKRTRVPVLPMPGKPLTSLNILRLIDSDFPARRGADRLAMLLGALPSLTRKVKCDMVLAGNFPVPPADAAVAPPPARWFNVARTFILELPDSFEAYLKGLRPKTRYNLKRQVTKLDESAGGTLQLKRYSSPDEIDELTGHFNVIWANSWHGTLKSDYLPPASCLKQVAQAGWLRSYVLLAKGQPIAYLLGYQYKRKYHYASVGYHRDWRAGSPGAVLNYLMLEELCGQSPPAEIDFGFGYNQYKESLGNVPQDRGEIWVPVKTRARLVLCAKGVADRAYAVAHNLATRTGVLKLLKKRMRGD